MKLYTDMDRLLARVVALESELAELKLAQATPPNTVPADVRKAQAALVDRHLNSERTIDDIKREWFLRYAAAVRQAEHLAERLGWIPRLEDDDSFLFFVRPGRTDEEGWSCFYVTLNSHGVPHFNLQANEDLGFPAGGNALVVQVCDDVDGFGWVIRSLDR